MSKQKFSISHTRTERGELEEEARNSIEKRIDRGKRGIFRLNSREVKYAQNSEGTFPTAICAAIRRSSADVVKPPARGGLRRGPSSASAVFTRWKDQLEEEGRKEEGRSGY